MASNDIREILIATDSSEASEATMRVAHAYARAFGLDCTSSTSRGPTRLG
jgi:hypothetical protein